MAEAYERPELEDALVEWVRMETLSEDLGTSELTSYVMNVSTIGPSE